MTIHHFRGTERRRTVRVTLSVPLTVHGHTPAGDKFSVRTHSRSVSGHGGLIALDPSVVVGQILILVNETRGESVMCRVVSIRRSLDGKTCVGIEFTSPDTNFWHMAFPIPGAKPLRRAVRSQIYASA